MNRLFRVLHRWKCKTAAQKLALDALRHLGDDSGRWPGMFLWHVESYLGGVAAPESEFRDYSNHVLYPVENWGGAARLARKWYWKTVERLRAEEWTGAAYDAGVLARYVTFAFSPPRAGYDLTALGLRTPIEWCVSRLYDELTADAPDPKPVSIPTGDDWLERLVTAGAEEAFCHLRTVTDRFDFDAVVRKPAALDDEVRSFYAKLLSRSAATLGAILGRAIAESGVAPPRYALGPAGLLALPSLPLFWFTRSQARRAERRPVRAIFREFKKSERIEDSLPEDARSVRDAYEIEVLKKSGRPAEPAKRTHAADPRREKPAAPVTKAAPPAAPATKAAEIAPKAEPKRASDTAKPAAVPAESKTRPDAATANERTPARPGTRSGPSVAEMTSVPAKLVPRLESAGVHSVIDLLMADAEQLAAALHPQATAADVTAWQDQARLCGEVAGLAPGEAQLLVACGVTGSDDLAALSPVELWELVVPVAESPDGRRLLRGEKVPDLDVVTRWIDAAKRNRKAA